MGWKSPSLMIGDVVLDVPRAVSLNQAYEFVGGRSELRMANGRMVVQSAWTRLKTSISGEGMVAPGLWGIDWTQKHFVSCATPLSAESATASVQVPANYRSDIPVKCVAWVDGRAVPTGIASASVSPTTGLASISAVPNADASSYSFLYWPVIEAYLTYSDAYNRSSGTWSWTITAEEA